MMGIFISKTSGQGYIEKPITCCNTVQSNKVPFTQQEIRFLQKHWTSINSHIDNNGNALYTEFFTKHPDLMTKFSFAVANAMIGYDLEKTLQDARLSFHIRRVFAIIGDVIESLDDYEQFIGVTKRCIKIGATHKRFALSKSDFLRFKSSFLVMISQSTNNTLEKDSMGLWDRIFDIIIDHMDIGLEEQPLMTHTIELEEDNEIPQKTIQILQRKQQHPLTMDEISNN